MEPPLNTVSIAEPLLNTGSIAEPLLNPVSNMEPLLNTVSITEPLRLNTVLLACNENPKYLDFWPAARRAWNEVVGVRCVLIYVGDSIPAHLQGDPDVVLFEPIAEWPTATQAQCVRLLYPALIECAGAVAINDIDMAPLRRDYYVDGFARHRADQFVSLRGIDDACKQVSMCDVAAAPATWGEMFGVRTLADVHARLREWAAANPADGVHGMDGGTGWCTDQLEFYKTVVAWRRDRPARVAVEPWFPPNHRRLCRSRPQFWATAEARAALPKWLAAGDFVDFHMPPWADCAGAISNIIGMAVAVSAPSQALLAEVITGDRLMMAAAVTPGVCYFKVDALVYGHPIKWRGAVHGPAPARVWVSGHSDFPVTEEMFNRYSHNCDVWFATNVEFAHPKLRPIPIGVTNDSGESELHNIYGNMAVLAEVAAEPRALAAAPAYANFSVGTYPVERAPLLERLRGQPWVDIGEPENSPEGRRRFLRAVRNHQFTICPRGNGIDTHRTWEALYMGSIPVLRRCVAVDSFAAEINGKAAPISFVDDWAELTPEFFAREYARLAPLMSELARVLPCAALPCPVLPCAVLPCAALPCPVLPCAAKLSYWVGEIARCSVKM